MKLMGSCLQLDVGNSSAKWRLMEDGHCQARGAYVSGDKPSEDLLLACTENLQQIWIASVASAAAEAELTTLLLARWGVQPWYARTTDQALGLHNSYADCSRMGVDRWLAMLAAWLRCRGPLVVVDAGSALTIDLVDGGGQHTGGYIIPGAALMERALLLDTDRVRFAEDVEYALSPGRSTAEAVRHGIALAQSGAVALALQQQDGDAVAPAVFYCGGGGASLQQLLAGAGSLVPDLVFEGLQAMAEANA